MKRACRQCGTPAVRLFEGLCYVCMGDLFQQAKNEADFLSLLVRNKIMHPHVSRVDKVPEVEVE